VLGLPRPPALPALSEEGVGVAVVSVRRNSPQALDPAVKSGNYLNNVLALGEARRRHAAHEAILCAEDGSVAEGASSNVFIVCRGEVVTPSLEVGILEGVTRAKVLELCQAHHIPCRQGRFGVDVLRAADEAFITSATRGVLPVTRIDGVPLGDGRPGPVTRRLLALYLDLLGSSAEAPAGAPPAGAPATAARPR
jgi:branched-chain amino acid aminotransferase